MFLSLQACFSLTARKCRTELEASSLPAGARCWLLTAVPSLHRGAAAAAGPGNRPSGSLRWWCEGCEAAALLSSRVCTAAAQQSSSSRVCAQCFSLENSFPHFLLLQVEPGRQKNAATVQFCAILTPCAQLAHCTLPSWWKWPLFMQNSRFWEILSQLYLRPLDIYVVILEYS